jgi:N-acetylglucosamine-6-phosphate deacetylase
MRVAEEFGFRIGTFQHVLEGYKVADEMARHGAMASTFSDWWAYKFEVYDAIPYNAALMRERGVVVSLNSDSTELARRLQLEAAKAVKWGGVPPEDALLMVTLNPARQLGVEDRVGSIEPGKDADLVLWSGSPLSTGSRPLRTWVDGILRFDREKDVARRPALEAERLALVAKAKAAREDGEGDGVQWGPAYLEEGHDDCMDNVTLAGEAEVMR